MSLCRAQLARYLASRPRVFSTSVLPRLSFSSQPLYLSRRTLHHTRPLLNETSDKIDQILPNIIQGEIASAVQVRSISESGLRLADGKVIRGPCIFLENQVFLWDVPSLGGKSTWGAWDKDMFEIFDVVVPKPEILLFGTGPTLQMPPPFVKTLLRDLGIQLEVMDTKNACSTYNLLTEEGRRVGAALLPLTPFKWPKKEQ